MDLPVPAFVFTKVHGITPAWGAWRDPGIAAVLQRVGAITCAVASDNALRRWTPWTRTGA